MELLGLLDTFIGILIVAAVLVVIATIIYLSSPVYYSGLGTVTVLVALFAISSFLLYCTMTATDIKDDIEDEYGIEISDKTAMKMVDNNEDMTEFTECASKGEEYQIYAFSIEDCHITLYKKQGDRYVPLDAME